MTTEATSGALSSNDLGAASEARCVCKDRALSACPGDWEPGCDLGNNPAHVRVHHMSADERAAMKRALMRSVTVLDGGVPAGH